jgi:CBS-domain-containing membrane protein
VSGFQGNWEGNAMLTMTKRGARLTLGPATASELMSPNPISINADAPIDEATALLTDRGFGAAPVIDEAGRPVGVISRADILIHERERLHRLRPSTDVVGAHGFAVEEVDPTLVSDVMTPAVFSVSADTAAELVVRQMCELRVHQLFVVDREGSLIGVISSLDIVRHLNAAE